MNENKRETRQLGMNETRQAGIQKLREAKAGKSRIDQFIEVDKIKI